MNICCLCQTELKNEHATLQRKDVQEQMTNKVTDIYQFWKSYKTNSKALSCQKNILIIIL